MNVEGHTAPHRCPCGTVTTHTAATRKHRASCAQAKAQRWTAQDRRDARRTP